MRADNTDVDVGPVRSYVRTHGRVAGRYPLRPDSLLRATGVMLPVTATADQRRVVAQVSTGTVSLAEVAARLRMPTWVAAVVASDCVESGHLSFHTAAVPETGVSVDILERVLAGLKRL